MALKAKRRTRTLPPPLNGSDNSNGFHKHEWQPGDPPEAHPLAGALGAFKDDPLWDEFVRIMKDLRREELERDLKNLEGES